MSLVRILLAVLLVSFSPVLPTVAAPARPIARITFNGRSYLRARDWALSKEMTTSWVLRNKTLQLAGGANRLWITADSPEIRFNGTSVFLSHPVVSRDGVFYVSALDVETVFTPLTTTPRLPAGKKVQTICLDPGHGGRDPGNQEGARQEKKYTLLLAQELRTQLTKLGFKVVLTRSKDAFVDLDQRPALARKSGADLFISLHFNAVASGKAAVRGAETYCLTPALASSTNARGVGAGTGAYRGNKNDAENLWLAFQIQKALPGALDTGDRGVRRARFSVLRDTAMPAVLVEAGFMSHPAEGKKIFDAEYRKQIARAIAEGVAAYKKSVERGD